MKRIYTSAYESGRTLSVEHLQGGALIRVNAPPAEERGVLLNAEQLHDLAKYVLNPQSSERRLWWDEPPTSPNTGSRTFSGTP